MEQDNLRALCAVPLFGSWCPVDVALPAMLNSVIVWGTLETETEPDSHEGYWSFHRWRSVRSDDETDLNLCINDVTHWMPRPRGPNVQDDSQEPVRGLR